MGLSEPVMSTEATTASRPSKGRVRSWLTACLLLTVFFLPLHFHVGGALASQITKECICLHGSRAQAAVSGAPASCAPPIPQGEVTQAVSVVPRSLSIHNPSSRAPPLPVSR